MADRFSLRDRIGLAREALAGKLSRLGERIDRRFSPGEDVPEEIDFSAPSVPYYADLAARFRLARFILILVLFVFTVVTLIAGRSMITYQNLYYLVKDIRASSLTLQSEADLLNYPVSVGTPGFALYRGGLVIAGSQEVTVLGSSGRETLKDNVAYTTPSVAASDKYFVTWGLGEKSFSVYNPFVRVYREETEYPVYDAAVADNGAFCVVTRSRDYRSEVLIYNGSMKLIADCHLNGYVTDVCMSPQGTVCGIVSMDAEDGVFVTTVTLVRLSDRITRETVTFRDTYAGVCGFAAEDRMAVVTGDRLAVLRPDGAIYSETTFDGEEPLLCTVSNGRIGILSRKAGDLSQNLLKVFDKNGRIVYTMSIATDRSPAQLTFNGSVLYVRAQDVLLRISADGRSVTQTSISRDTVTVLPDEGGGVLVCGPAYASRRSVPDFVSP